MASVKDISLLTSGWYNQFNLSGLIDTKPSFYDKVLPNGEILTIASFKVKQYYQTNVGISYRSFSINTNSQSVVSILKSLTNQASVSVCSKIKEIFNEKRRIYETKISAYFLAIENLFDEELLETTAKEKKEEVVEVAPPEKEKDLPF